MTSTRTTTTTNQYNDDALLQSSDDDSDIEDMLNEPPTFSQTSQSYSPSQQPEEEQQSTPSITKEESVEEKAQQKAKHLELLIADDITCPSELYWHRKSKKKDPFPCRLCKESELVLATNLQGKPWNKEKNVLVQYMGEYQPNQRALVPKNSLTPFNGNAEEAETWCPSIVKEYIKALGKRSNYTPVDLRIEELYLDLVLNKARENQEAAIEAAKEEQVARQLELESDDESNVAAPVKPPPPKPRPEIKSLNGQPDNPKHKLRAGDVIEYTHPMFVQGRPEGYRCTTILSIPKHKAEYPLKLQNAEFLPPSHLIRRVQRLVRNKLVEYNGHVRAISDFRMEHDSLNVSTSIKEQAKEVGAIIDRNVAKYQPKLEAVGLPMDLLNNMNGKKRTRGGKENETDVAVNEQEDLKMAPIGTTEGCEEPPNKKRLVDESPFKDDASRPIQPKTSDATQSVQKTNCGDH